MSEDHEANRVCILLATYNGAADLPEQLQSYVDQDHRAWDLRVSDDGSRDDSLAILRDFADRVAPRGHAVHLGQGPRAGFAANFLSLIGGIPPGTRWVALSDQDDVWLPDRLSRGLAALAKLPRDAPALYCSRTWITDQDLGRRRLSKLFSRAPGFRNALVQNIAAGNTILLNPAAVELARAAAPGAATVPGVAAHDWWLYQLVTGAGGRVINDAEPTLLYRQHAANLIGANDGWRARMSRMKMLLSGRMASWNSANIAALETGLPHLTPENRAVLARFAALRRRGLLPRLWAFARLGLYRQTRLEQAALWLALMLRKF